MLPERKFDKGDRVRYLGMIGTVVNYGLRKDGNAFYSVRLDDKSFSGPRAIVVRPESIELVLRE